MPRSRRGSCGDDDPDPTPPPTPTPGGGGDEPSEGGDDTGVDTCEVCGDCGGDDDPLASL